jgi:D-beta-D-heptose 7-phosphate kinase / D-beta-D-heptose 1-phosphate adenosyltransferase
MKQATEHDFINLVQGRRVLVVGDCMLDTYSFGEVNRISPEAPVPVFLEGRTESKAGGAANVALNLSGLGLNVSLFGAWAQDEAGKKLENVLVLNEVNDFLSFEHCLTTEKHRVVARGQQMLRIDRELAFEWGEESLNLLESELQRLNGIELVVVSDYNKGFISSIFMDTLRTYCKRKKISFITDPKVKDWSIYRESQWLTPNLNELGLAIGLNPENTDKWVESALRIACQQLDGTSIAVTRAENGISYCENNTVAHCAATAREVYDVCGAGDTVLAIVAAGFLSGMSSSDIFRLANHAAGLVVAKQGTVAVKSHWFL